MLFSPAQCRAARALLGWSQGQLADASKVAVKTIADYERGERTPYDRTLADLIGAFELARIEFTNGGNPGVRIRGDKSFGHLYDETGHVGWIKDGELRAGRERRLVALVRDDNLHDSVTGDYICGLSDLGVGGQPLPAMLKARLTE